MPRVDDAKAATETPPVSPNLATPSEVAKALRTTEAALSQDRYLNQGIPYCKHGRRVLYRWADVHAYLAAHTVTPESA